MKVAHLLRTTERRQVDVDVSLAILRDAAWCATVKWQHMPFYADANGAASLNTAVREAYENGADLLLLQAPDVFALPPSSLQEIDRGYARSALDALWRSMAKVGAAVIGAPGPNRGALWGQRYEGIVSCDLMLLDLRKLRELARPFFHPPELDIHGELVDLDEGESFCARARAARLGVWVEASIPTAGAVTRLTRSPAP